MQDRVGDASASGEEEEVGNVDEMNTTRRPCGHSWANAHGGPALRMLVFEQRSL